MRWYELRLDNLVAVIAVLAIQCLCLAFIVLRARQANRRYIRAKALLDEVERDTRRLQLSVDLAEAMVKHHRIMPRHDDIMFALAVYQQATRGILR